jgi:hypothetical protein
VRSPVERLGRTVPRALLLAVLWLGIAAAVPATAQTSDEAPTDAQIERAVAALKADPNLQTEGTIRRLRWASESQRREPSSSLRWLRDLVTWIAQSAWVLVWVVGGLLLLALVACEIDRTCRQFADADARSRPRHPSRKPARRHRRSGSRSMGARRTARRPRLAVSRAVVAARSRARPCDPRFEHRRRMPGSGGANARAGTPPIRRASDRGLATCHVRRTRARNR